LAITLVILCLAASFSLPKTEDRETGGTSMQEQIDNASAAPAQQQPAQQQPAAQPAQQQPAQQQPAAQPAPGK
jgi:hypothetical protein